MSVKHGPECHVCFLIGENPGQYNTVISELAGVSEATVRRHRQANTSSTYAASIRDPETGSWYKVKYGSEDSGPKWPVVQPAQPVNIVIENRPEPNYRGDYKLALKCADTQIGFRAIEDGYESFHDDSAMDLFTQVVIKEQPDKIDILGDFLDLPSQSRWAQEAGFARTTQMALDRAYEWLSELRAAAPNAEITIIEGNHDKRLQTYVETNALAAFGLRKAGLPSDWPVMSLPNLLRLEELNVKYMDAYPTAATWDNDQVRNMHGTKANSRGSTTAQYSQELPHISQWVGHTHRAEITYRTVMGPRGDAIETYVANPGCLCKTDGTVPSVHGAIHADGSSARVVENWQAGWGANYYNETDSWPFVYRIKDGRTMWHRL